MRSAPRGGTSPRHRPLAGHEARFAGPVRESRRNPLRDGAGKHGCSPGRRPGLAGPDTPGPAQRIRGGASAGAGAGSGGVPAVVHGDQRGSARGGEKGRPVYDRDALAEAHDGHWVVLTGCRKGAVPAALAAGGPEAALAELRALTGMFGPGNVMAELTFHDQPGDDERNEALAGLAAAAGIGVVATGNVHYASPAQARLAEALAAIRARRSLDEMDGWLPASGAAYIRSGAEMSHRLRRFPGVQERTVELARSCAFDFRVIAPGLPDFGVPEGYNEMSWLRALVAEQAPKRYGPPGAEWEPGAYRQIEHELSVIEELRFPGYFLLVHDIVRFCENRNILCQGRGSAANSAVCYALGITSVDAVRHGLLFERFLSAGPGRPARHRSGHRAPAPRGGDPVRLRGLRPGPGRPGRQRDLLPAADGAAGRGPRPRPPSRGAGRVVAAGRSRGGRGKGRGRSRRRGRAGGADAAAPAAPGHPLRRDGHLRPAGGRGVPGGVGADARPQRPAVGQGRLRLRRARQVRPARPGHAVGPARLLRPRRNPLRPSVEPELDPAGGRRRLRDAPGGGHRRGFPGRVAGPDVHLCRGCARRSSTTSWWRSR